MDEKRNHQDGPWQPAKPPKALHLQLKASQITLITQQLFSHQTSQSSTQRIIHHHHQFIPH
jgi:hypothetical protein